MIDARLRRRYAFVAILLIGMAAGSAQAGAPFATSTILATSEENQPADGEHSAGDAAVRPNFLWISCEDIGPHLGCYQHPCATSPTLDRLAAEGVRFTQASSVTGVCATCRSSIITGMYASTLGSQFMRCRIALPAQVRLFPDYLRDAGYYCCNNVKTDYNIQGDDKRCWNDCSRQAHWRHRAAPDQPFFAVFNLTMTHESQVFNYRPPAGFPADQLHDPQQVVLPPYFPDTPIVRQDWAHYLDNIQSMDARVGEILAELAADGLADNTVVFFWSDHGAGLPRNKRWIYESGTRVPLIVRVPARWRHNGQGQPGTVSEELVSLLDLPATLLHLANLSIPAHFQGQPFLGPERAPPRERIYTIRDRMDERYDMVRGVRTSRYKYLCNFQPYLPYFPRIQYMEQEHTMQELRRLHGAGQLPPAAAQFMASEKPREEFYDLAADPHEIRNLLTSAESLTSAEREILDRLRAELRDWMRQTRDTGLIPEAELAAREARSGTRYAILQGADGLELIDQLLAANEDACAAAPDRQRLAALLTAEDAAVRYWGYVGWCNRARRGQPATPEDLVALHRGLDDRSMIVRIVAARALWLYQDPQPALTTIAAALEGQAEYEQLAALHLLEELGDAGRPLWPQLPKWQASPFEYPARVAATIRAQVASSP